MLLFLHGSHFDKLLHAQGVANRDLKLENLLLDRDGRDGTRPLLKICDFGYSKHEMNSSAKTGVGTPVYMAPEVIMGDNKYDAKVGACVTQWCLIWLHGLFNCIRLLLIVTAGLLMRHIDCSILHI